MDNQQRFLVLHQQEARTFCALYPRLRQISRLFFFQLNVSLSSPYHIYFCLTLI